MSGGLRYRSLEDMPPTMRTMVAKAETPVSEAPAQRKNKYGAVPTVVDGIRFDSKREARYFEKLVALQSTGHIRYFLRQVPIRLPGGTKLVIDFQVFLIDGSVEYVDAKGRETDAFKIKLREVEAIYPFKIILV